MTVCCSLYRLYTTECLRDAHGEQYACTATNYCFRKERGLRSKSVVGDFFLLIHISFEDTASMWSASLSADALHQQLGTAIQREAAEVRHSSFESSFRFICRCCNSCAGALTPCTSCFLLQRQSLRQQLEAERSRRVAAEARLAEQQEQAAAALAEQATDYKEQMRKLEAQVIEKDALIATKAEEAACCKQQLAQSTATLAKRDDDLARHLKAAAADKLQLEEYKEVSKRMIQLAQRHEGNSMPLILQV
jgi:hypothetical protein